jgi:hypothetical protein
MLNKRRKHTEGFVTFITLVGLLTIVCSLMVNEVKTLTESFSTLFTFIGLLSSVNALMLKKMSLLTKGLSTLAAAKVSPQCESSDAG